MNSIRPDSLDTFIGQSQAKKILGVLLSACNKRHDPLPHLLFVSGYPGVGKTTLARIISGGNLVEVVGGNMKEPDEMIAVLSQLKPYQCLFIDEIHAVPRHVEELLYSAMEDGIVSAVDHSYSQLMKNLGMAGMSGISGKAKTSINKTIKLPPFTLIGASTTAGELSAPLRSRFHHIIELVPYTVEELTAIVIQASNKLEFPLPHPIAVEIARRSRQTARICIGHLLFFRDYVQGSGIPISMEALQESFALRGIDGMGLGGSDRAYLKALSDGACGIDTLSAALNESPETIQCSIEPFLLQQGFIRRTRTGRILTEKASGVIAA